jgi:succinyl-CoA synthetase beta subunit
VKLLEHQGKQLLDQAGIRTPQSVLTTLGAEAEQAAAAIGGRVVLKAQVPTGKRGKAGAILFADSSAEAGRHAVRLLGMEVDGYRVHDVLVEECVGVAHELYAAVLNDATSKGPLVLFSTCGGMDIEEVNAATPDLVRRLAVDINAGLDHAAAQALVAETDLAEPLRPTVARALVELYGVYREADADLAEINPLVVTHDGDVIALDAKVSIRARCRGSRRSWSRRLRTRRTPSPSWRPGDVRSGCSLSSSPVTSGCWPTAPGSR